MHFILQTTNLQHNANFHLRTMHLCSTCYKPSISRPHTLPLQIYTPYTSQYTISQPMLKALTSQGFLYYPMTFRPLYTTLHLHTMSLYRDCSLLTSHLHNPNQTVTTPMNDNTIDKRFPAQLTHTQPHEW